MERLIHEWEENGEKFMAICACEKECKSKGKRSSCCCKPVIDVRRKLFAYEDLNRTPEELSRDLADLAQYRAREEVGITESAMIELTEFRRLGKNPFEISASLADLAAYCKLEADGELVRVVRCKDCFWKTACGAKHGNEYYCAESELAGERRDAE